MKTLKNISLGNINGITHDEVKFDIIHNGHIYLLERAREQGDMLVVLLNSDSSIKRNKGDKRPIVPEMERAQVLAALRTVDYVVIFDEDKPLKCLEKIKPNVHVKGGSYILERVAEEKRLVESWGGRCEYFELNAGVSTTSIIERIIQIYKT